MRDTDAFFVFMRVFARRRPRARLVTMMMMMIMMFVFHSAFVRARLSLSTPIARSNPNCKSSSLCVALDDDPSDDRERK